MPIYPSDPGAAKSNAQCWNTGRHNEPLVLRQFPVVSGEFSNVTPVVARDLHSLDGVNPGFFSCFETYTYR
jgi:hypothetical protein